MPLRRLKGLGISARSATVAAIAVLVAFALAGAILDVVLYRFMMAGVDDATANRVRSIVSALHAESPDDLDPTLLTTNQRVVAIQVIGPSGAVIKRVAIIAVVAGVLEEECRALEEVAVMIEHASLQSSDRPHSRITFTTSAQGDEPA